MEDNSKASFEIRVITSSDDIPEEAEQIKQLLECGVDYVHIRKPNSTMSEVKSLIEDIPYRYRKQLILHGHFELLNEMNLGGVNLNYRNRVAPRTAKMIGISCHSIGEAISHKDKDYILLSPIFPSISKPGYGIDSKICSLNELPQSLRVIGLGGVTPNHFARMIEMGFKGGAMLGYIWENDFRTVLSEINGFLHKE